VCGWQRGGGGLLWAAPVAALGATGCTGLLLNPLFIVRLRAQLMPGPTRGQRRGRPMIERRRSTTGAHTRICAPGNARTASALSFRTTHPHRPMLLLWSRMPPGGGPARNVVVSCPPPPAPPPRVPPCSTREVIQGLWAEGCRGFYRGLGAGPTDPPSFPPECYGAALQCHDARSCWALWKVARSSITCFPLFGNKDCLPSSLMGSVPPILGRSCESAVYWTLYEYLKRSGPRPPAGRWGRTPPPANQKACVPIAHHQKQKTVASPPSSAFSHIISKPDFYDSSR